MTDTTADVASRAAGDQILADHNQERAEAAQRIIRFANWTPGMRLDGSRLLIKGIDGITTQLGIVTNGVLTGES